MTRWMRFVIIAALVVLVGACSQGGGDNQSAGQDQVKIINDMMAKGYPLTDNQKQEIADLTAEGKKLQAEGKKAEANAAFEKALAILKLAAESDRFNKAE